MTLTPLIRANDYHARPEPIKWPARVAAHLAALPPGDPAQDLALVEAAMRGDRISAFDRPRLRDRQKLLLAAAHDDNGKPCLDGRAALIEAVRARVTA